MMSRSSELGFQGRVLAVKVPCYLFVEVACQRPLSLLLVPAGDLAVDAANREE